MCEHLNRVIDECGTSTCADCCRYFDKILCDTTPNHDSVNYNGLYINLKKSKSSIIQTLEKNFGIYDARVARTTELIFNLTSANKTVKGINKKSILFASLYYAYCFLEKPKNLDEMLVLFDLNHKNVLKGFKLCQIAMQESNLEEIKKIKDRVHLCIETHRENLQKLISTYNIPLKNYDEIEKIVIVCHLKMNKTLTNKITDIWVSCIFFWLLKVNPHLEPEDFISMSQNNISLHKLRSDLTYLKKNLS
jgi:hypothetical protein